MKRIIRILAVMLCMLGVLCAGFALAEDPALPLPPNPQGDEPTPSPTPIPTPSPEELGILEFVIDGPDDSMPMTITYRDFQQETDENNQNHMVFSLDNLTPGTYTVTEQNATNLLQHLTYTFDAQNSVQTMTFEVTGTGTGAEGGDGRIVLRNVYTRTVEVTPTPTPEPEGDEIAPPTEEPEEILPSVPDERISVPVIKKWDDQGNRDGNRPDRVIVKLLVDGHYTGIQAVLTAATGWTAEFTDLPKYSAHGEIQYSLEEETVPYYTPRVEGYEITNKYEPVTTTATVSKIWMDNNNAAGIRPPSIYCTLSNGISVELNEGNGWTATVRDLPKIVGGREVTYTWTEQQVIGYEQTGADASGNDMIFTNTIIQREEEAPEGKNAPEKRRGTSFLIIDDYGTPLGVDVVINHVGDCFD